MRHKIFQSIQLLLLFTKGFANSSIPGEVINNKYAAPIVSLQSLPINSYSILRKFNVKEHLPKESRDRCLEYFLNRNRCVYLTPDRLWVIKIWEENHPNRHLFWKAFLTGFYDEISKIQGVIFDENGVCRGYITPYMISRDFQRDAWNQAGLLLKKNSLGINIFSNCKKQPTPYLDLFNSLLKATYQTDLALLDFCPNNVVIDPENNRLYLIDLEEIENMEEISIQDPRTQIRLTYNPEDYLKAFHLHSNAP